MNRRRADAVVGVLVGFVLLGGGALSWQAYQQRRAIDQSMGSMMDSSAGVMYGVSPLWYAFGTLLVASTIGGMYLLVRAEIPAPSAGEQSAREVSDSGRAAGANSTQTDPQPAETDPQPAESLNPEAHPRSRVLDLLPDDERRVLEPVLDSPGITQIELRDRSKFSKSKVSQTASALEERGLLYRERQGRTFRIYPSEDLQQQSEP